MMVTTGGRGCSVSVGVGRVEQALLDVGLGDAADGVADFLGDDLRGVGVDDVGDLDHLPCFISSLITSTARSAMRLASSWTVIASGMTTSRMIFSCAG